MSLSAVSCLLPTQAGLLAGGAWVQQLLGQVTSDFAQWG